MQKRSQLPGYRRYLLQLRKYQRVLGAALAAIAVFGMVTVLRPPAIQTVPVVVAASDIATGHVLTEADVTIKQWPKEATEQLPLAVDTQVIGRATTGPIAAAEPITTTRIVSPEMLDQLNAETTLGEGLVAAPIRLADSAQAGLLKAGDIIDVLAARATAGDEQKASTIAVDVPVLSVPHSKSEAGGGLLGSGPASSGRGGEIIVVAVDRATAIDLAAAATRSQLSVVLKAKI